MQGTHEFANDREGNVLSAVRIRIMRYHYDSPPNGGAGRTRGWQRSPCCFQPCIAISSIRLQMRTFRPFIPRVHENQTFIAPQARARVRHRVLEPFLVAFGAGMHKDGASAAMPRFVVPRRTNAAK